MGSLSDLPEEELARALAMSVAELRAFGVRDWPVLTDKSIEDVASLSNPEQSNAFAASAFGYLSEIPEDVAVRWRQLQDLLRREPEFETRYLAAFEALFTSLQRTPS